MKNLLNIILLLVFGILVGCSPSTKLNRLLIRHPELKISDTIYMCDTVTFPQAVVDTLFSLRDIQDSIFVQNDHLEIKINRIRDTLYLKGKCEADTVILHHSIPVEKIKVIKPDKIDQLISRIPWLVSGLIVLLLFTIIIVVKIFR